MSCVRESTLLIRCPTRARQTPIPSRTTGGDDTLRGFDGDDTMARLRDGHTTTAGRREAQMDGSPKIPGRRVERGGWRGLLAGVVAGLLLALIAVDDVRAQERNRARDFDFTLEAMDPGQSVGGTWTDGTTMWRIEGRNESLVAYDMTTGRRDPARSITASLLQGLVRDSDLWSDGTTMWILAGGFDFEGHKLWAFSMATWERDGAKDVEFRDGFGPGAIWSDGATIWVTDRFAVLAYDWATGRREPAKDIRSEYFRVHDIWSDGTTMWIAGQPDQYEPQQPKVRAYDLATGQRVPAREIDTGDLVPGTLGSDGRTMWIGDREDNLYAYRLSTGNRESAKDVSLLSRPVLVPRGLWSNGRKAWVLTDYPEEIWVYDLATGHRDFVVRPERVLGRRQLTSYPSDIWSDGTTMWIAYRGDRYEEHRLYAYDLATGQRDSAKDVELERLDPGPKFDLIRKIWSDGRTLWVVNAGHLEQGEVTYVYAYDWPSGRRVPAKDLELDNSNRRPEDVWTDGTTMWVLDGRDGMVAYDLSTGNLDPGRSFDLPDAGRSFWSDGTTMWVAVWDDTTVYAYDLATGNRNPARDYPSLLGPSWPELHGSASFGSDGRTLWVADAGTVYAFELARNREPAKDLIFLSEGWGGDGLWSNDGRTLWALDDGRLRAYDLDSDQGPRPRTLLPRETRRFELPGEGGDLWSDGATMWIPAGGGNVLLGTSTAPKLYGHDLAADAWDGFGPPPDHDREFALDPANANPSGLWSDGETMWVADAADAKLYAYDWPTGARLRDREFDTLTAAGNTFPGAIWSEGTTMWVANNIHYDRKLYAYHMPRGGRVFTDLLLEAGVTVFRTVHVTELRDRIDNLRIANGLSAFSWTDPVILSGVTPIRAVHLTELRTALDQAYAAAGRIRPRYAEAIRAGGVIKAVHVTELRRLVVALE